MRISDWSSDVCSSDLRILSAIDARMGEVYSGAFELRDGGLAALSHESVCAPDVVELPAGDDHWQGIGTGFAAVDSALRARLGRRRAQVDATPLPHAAHTSRKRSAGKAGGRRCRSREP